MREAEQRKLREYRSYSQPQDERLRAAPVSEDPNEELYPDDLVEKAHRALQVGFVAVATIAGIDKFANEITDWTQYLSPEIPRLVNLHPQYFMYGVGVFEVIIGIGLALRPRIFGDVFAVWLSLIIVNLLFQGQYFDIALHDFGLAAGACALARLSKAKERGFDWSTETGSFIKAAR